LGCAECWQRARSRLIYTGTSTISQFRRLSDSVLASPQISLEDIEHARAEGVTLIVCNRPDGEDPGQLESESIRQTAAEKGIDYLSIPITASGFSEPQVAAMADALAGAEGKVLAYCRSGTRSTLLWALAQASTGGDPDVLAAQARAAGYDVAPVRPAMDILAAKHR
jgi:uncharacterized protein (TIGR01244 family)